MAKGQRKGSKKRGSKKRVSTRVHRRKSKTLQTHRGGANGDITTWYATEGAGGSFTVNGGSLPEEALYLVYDDTNAVVTYRLPNHYEKQAIDDCVARGTTAAGDPNHGGFTDNTNDMTNASGIAILNAANNANPRYPSYANSLNQPHPNNGGAGHNTYAGNKFQLLQAFIAGSADEGEHIRLSAIAVRTPQQQAQLDELNARVIDKMLIRLPQA